MQTIVRSSMAWMWLGFVCMSVCPSSQVVADPASERVLIFSEDECLGHLLSVGDDFRYRPRTLMYPPGAFDGLNRWISLALGSVTVPADQLLELRVVPCEYFTLPEWDVWAPMNDVPHPSVPSGNPHKNRRESEILSKLNQRDARWLSAKRESNPDRAFSLAALQTIDAAAIYALDLSNKPTIPRDSDMQYVAHLTGLHSLSMDGSQLTAKGYGFLKALTALDNLLIVRIGPYSKEFEISDAVLGDIGTLQKLTYLKLWATSASDGGLASLGQLKNLRELDIYGEFTGIGLSHFGESSPLQVLRLEGPNLNSSVFESLGKFPTLKALRLEGRGSLSASGLGALRRCPDLEELGLDLGENPLPAEGLRALADQPHLRLLSISSLSLRDEDIARLGPLPRSLEELRLSSPQVTNASIPSLARLCSSLRKLVLATPAIDEDGDRMLRQLSPKDCELERSFGAFLLGQP